MSDQQAPPNGDSPAVAGPDEAPGTAQDQQTQDTPGEAVDWEQRYKDTQADYTRQQQAYKEAENREQWYRTLVTTDDPDIQRQAADILGIELEGSDEESESFEEFTDEDEPYLSRAEWEQFQAQRREEQQQAQQAMELDYLAENARAQFKELGAEEIDDDTAGFILNQAWSLPRLPPAPGQPLSGLLDIKTAYQQFQALMDNQMKSWAKTKRAPYVSPGGLPANEVPDPGHGQQARLNRAMLSLRNSIGDE